MRRQSHHSNSQTAVPLRPEMRLQMCWPQSMAKSEARTENIYAWSSPRCSISLTAADHDVPTGGTNFQRRAAAVQISFRAFRSPGAAIIGNSQLGKIRLNCVAVGDLNGGVHGEMDGGREINRDVTRGSLQL